MYSKIIIIILKFISSVFKLFLLNNLTKKCIEFLFSMIILNIYLYIYSKKMYITEELKREVRQRTAQFQSVENDRKWFRKDQCWAWINRTDYWNRDSVYWWEIDHITPIANWGLDALSNLRVLHRKNNVSKSDWRLVCSIRSYWVRNVAVC